MTSLFAQDPVPARIAILIALAVVYALYHAVRSYRKRKDAANEPVPGAAAQAGSCQGAMRPPVAEGPVHDGESAKTELERQPEPEPEPSAPVAGENAFLLARDMMHQEIPDFWSDGLYLSLLGESAEQGYAPAMAKLGEYAMRRAAWVEAYYWMKQAQRNGMLGLLPTLWEIRRNWSLDGFPDELENVNTLFTAEAGSIGRALLHLDSGFEAANAKAYLKANHPEFIAD